MNDNAVNNEDAKVILMSGGTNLVPLAKELHNRKYLIASIIPRFAEVLNQIDIPSMPLAKVVTPELQAEVSQLSLENISKINIVNNVDNLSPLISEYITRRLSGYLFRKIPEIITAIRAIEAVSPDLIILHNDVEPILRVVALWAREHGVPCLHVPHAIYVDSAERTEIGTDVHDLVSATHLACAGDYQQQWYVDRGFPFEQTYKTGLPQFDVHANNDVDRERACRLLKIDPNKPIVVYASSWRQDTNIMGCHDGVEQTYVAFVKAIKDQPVQAIIKLHPNANQQSIKWHIDIAEQEKSNCIVTSKHLNVVLPCTDIMVSFGPSNILLDASCFNAHLVCTHGYDNDDVVVKMGNEPTEEDIRKTIIDVLGTSRPSMENFRYKYCGVVDGQANKRIANVVDELLDAK